MTHSILAAIALTLVTSTVSAQHNPYSYASQYERYAGTGNVTHSFPGCEAEAEATLCLDSSGAELEGLECAREMQSIYADCVARDVCERWYEGLIESEAYAPTNHGSDDSDDDNSLYLGCLSLVVATGGEY